MTVRTDEASNVILTRTDAAIDSVV